MLRFVVAFVLPATLLAAPQGFVSEFGAGAHSGRLDGEITGNGDAGTYSSSGDVDTHANGYRHVVKVRVGGNYAKNGQPHLPLDAVPNLPGAFNGPQGAQIIDGIVKGALAALPSVPGQVNADASTRLAEAIAQNLQSVITEPAQFNPDNLKLAVGNIVRATVGAAPSLTPLGVPSPATGGNPFPPLATAEQLQRSLDASIDTLAPAIRYAQNPENANRDVNVKFGFGPARNYVSVQPIA